jgi:hypothetical protein
MTDQKDPGGHPVIMAIIVLGFFAIAVIIGLIIYNCTI